MIALWGVGTVIAKLNDSTNIRYFQSDQVSSDSTYMKCPEKANHYRIGKAD